MQICLAATLADRKGELIDKGRHTWPALAERFSHIAMHATETTHPDWLRWFDEHNVPYRTAPAGVDVIGLHRRRALQLAVETAADRYVYADLDHMLRWVERMPADLDRVLAQAASADCVVIGRSAGAFAAAPKRLRDTEAIANHIFELATGHAFDLMMAARCFSPAAARHVAAKSEVDTVGNDVAWPMLCETAGFTLGYVDSDGLTYETNTVYANDSRDEQDADAQAWMARIGYLAQHVAAMKPFLQHYLPRRDGYPNGLTTTTEP